MVARKSWEESGARTTSPQDDHRSSNINTTVCNNSPHVSPIPETVCSSRNNAEALRICQLSRRKTLLKLASIRTRPNGKFSTGGSWLQISQRNGLRGTRCRLEATGRWGSGFLCCWGRNGIWCFLNGYMYCTHSNFFINHNNRFDGVVGYHVSLTLLAH